MEYLRYNSEIYLGYVDGNLLRYLRYISGIYQFDNPGIYLRYLRYIFRFSYLRDISEISLRYEQHGHIVEISLRYLRNINFLGFPDDADVGNETGSDSPPALAKAAQGRGGRAMKEKDGKK